MKWRSWPGGVLSRSYGQTPDEGELGYLALHFALALERSHQPPKKNLIIVCASGGGSSQILLYKVKNRFRDYIDEVRVVESYKLPAMDLSGYDLILSTIPLPYELKIPVIQVQYFLDDESVAAVEHVLRGGARDVDFIRQCFREDMFFTGLRAGNREEAIALMCQLIDEKKKLPEDFYDLVIAREQVSPTEIGYRVAVPHPVRLVLDETFVAIGILEKPVKWGKKMVKFIFMLCINRQSEEALSVFNEVLSSLLLDHEFIDELERNPRFATVAAYLETLAPKKSSDMADSIFQ